MFINILLSIALLSTVVFVVPRKMKWWVAMFAVAVGAVVAIWQATLVLIQGVEQSFGQSSNLLFSNQYVAIDPLSAIFMIIISIAAVSVTIYARGYLASYIDKKSLSHISLHYLALVLLFISMIFVVTARAGYGFLFWWELMTVSSFVLILFEAQKREVRKAALSYLILMHIGFVFLLVGFVTLAAADLPVTFYSLKIYFTQNNPIPLFVVFLIGFGMKAGIFPLHVWLPEAHPAAPAHISAFMSGVMIKMGVYGVLRVVSYIDSQLLTVGIVIFAVGIVTGLWGVVLATVQSDIKRLLAYSSIENIGIIFIAIGAAIIGRADHNNMLTLCAMSGAILHTINHSMFKTVLFMGAGNVYTQTHTTEIESLGGLAKRMPVSSTVLLVATIAICSLPPLCGFVSEFLIYYGLFDTISFGSSGVVSALVGIIALSLIGGVVVIAFTKLFGVVFLGSPRSDNAAMAEEVDGFRIAACGVPLAGMITIGVAPILFINALFNISGDMMQVDNAATYAAMISPNIWQISITIGVLLLITAALLIARRASLKGRTVESSPTWGCGFTSPNARMQYSGESFAEGLQSISTSLIRNTGTGEAVDKDEIFPQAHSFNVQRKDKINTLFTAWWVELIHKINHRVMSLRTGKVNYYILYALMFLVLILLLSLLNII